MGKIRTKFIFFITLILAATATSLGGFFANNAMNFIKSEKYKKVNVLAQNLITNINYDLYIENIDAVKKNQEALFKDEDIEYMVIQDNSGKVVMKEEKNRTKDIHEFNYPIELEISSKKQNIGILKIGLNLRNINQIVFRAMITSWIITAIILVISGILVSVFVFYLTKPIKILDRAMEKVAEGNLDQELYVKSKDEIGNLTKSFNIMISRLKSHEGMLVKTTEEITKAKIEKAQAEEKQKMQAQLIQTEKLASIGELSSGIAHELNNPLAVVLGYSQLLLNSVADEQIKKDLKVIEESAVRCKNIVEGLLQFARANKEAFSGIDINDVLKKTLSLIGNQLTLSKIEVITSFLDKLPVTSLNVPQIQQVFINIIVNAKDAMKNGGKLEIKTYQEKSNICISFKDTGHGMSEEVKKKVFDPFFTTKPAGSGTGLGLSVSFGIVKSHNGAIEVESEEGKGSTFIVKLPIGDGS